MLSCAAFVLFGCGTSGPQRSSTVQTGETFSLPAGSDLLAVEHPFSLDALRHRCSVLGCLAYSFYNSVPRLSQCAQEMNASGNICTRDVDGGESCSEELRCHKSEPTWTAANIELFEASHENIGSEHADVALFVLAGTNLFRLADWSVGGFDEPSTRAVSARDAPMSLGYGPGWVEFTVAIHNCDALCDAAGNGLCTTWCDAHEVILCSGEQARCIRVVSPSEDDWICTTDRAAEQACEQAAPLEAQ